MVNIQINGLRLILGFVTAVLYIGCQGALIIYRRKIKNKWFFPVMSMICIILIIKSVNLLFNYFDPNLEGVVNMSTPVLDFIAATLVVLVIIEFRKKIPRSIIYFFIFNLITYIPFDVLDLYFWSTVSGLGRSISVYFILIASLLPERNS